VSSNNTANPVTGTASVSVPIALTEGRGGFGPKPALSAEHPLPSAGARVLHLAKNYVAKNAPTIVRELIAAKNWGN